MNLSRSLYLRIYGHARDYLYASDDGPVKFILSLPLLLIGQVYFLCTRLRRALYATRFLNINRVDSRVISVGNLTLGGSGKTTVTMELAEYLRDRGFSIAVLSRGYKGSRSSKYPVPVSVGNGPLLDVREAGDEPFMMAERLGKGTVVIIGKDRVRAAHMAVREFGCEFLILDDAYQFLSLYKDLEILLINENDLDCRIRPFPAGRFREPISSSRDADVVVIMRGLDSAGNLRGCEEVQLSVKTIVEAAPEVIDARAVWPEAGHARIERLKGMNVLAFTSIARTEMFRETLKRLEPKWFKIVEFPDHHYYCPGELCEIKDLALEHDAVIITTEKDSVKVDWSMFEDRRCFTLVPRYNLFDNESKLKNMVDGFIEERERGAP
jgi:tetraacyldisaccharide 4'-kinase